MQAGACFVTIRLMTSSIHPELQEPLRRAPVMRLTHGNLWFWRALVNLSPAAKPPADVLLEDRFLPSPEKDRKIRIRTYQPRSAVSLVPGLLWLHGGGLVMGRPEIDDALCCRFAREAGIVVVSVQYRYAPRYPFPAGLEDAYTALQWMHTQGRQIRIDPHRLGVGGNSAGGGLAAALAQMTHDRGAIPLKTQHLVYPMLDDRSSINESLPADSPVWNRTNNRVGWEAYLGQPCGMDDLPPYAVPARRADLTGLPPAFIGVGTLDLFLPENTDYARRLQAHGVDCDLHIVPGAYHGFDALAREAQVTQEFIGVQINALKKNLFSGKRIFTAADMIPGRTYRVVRAFHDFDRSLHDAGETWTYVNKNFLPYDDGLSVFVEQDGKTRMFRMQWREEEQGEIIDTFSEYVDEL